MSQKYHLRNKVKEARQDLKLSIQQLCLEAGMVSASGKVMSNSLVLCEKNQSNVTTLIAIRIFSVLKKHGFTGDFHDLFWVESAEDDDKTTNAVSKVNNDLEAINSWS